MNIQRLKRFPPFAAFSAFWGVTVNVGEHFPLCTFYMTLCQRIRSSVGFFFLLVSFQGWIVSPWVIIQTWKRVWVYRHVSNIWITPPNDPNTASWDRWTILEADTKQYSPPNHVPIPPQWMNHNRKSATVLKYIRTSFHTDSKANRKREHSLHFHYCDQIGRALTTVG